MRLRHIFALLAVLLCLGVMTGCGSDKKEIKIGVAMPSQTRQRWNQDGANIEKKLLEQGYTVNLQYANNEPDLQVKQIDAMVQQGCKVIIIASVDAYALSDVLDRAKSEGAKIISYDRLIMNTDAVDYYATFDNMAVGTMQGEYIENKLGLKEGNGPYNLEIFAGDMADNNTLFLFEGSMDVLHPYLKNGQLVIRSGETELKQCSIPRWSDTLSKERMARILATHYTDANLDVALCANDSTALGVLGALLEAGYNTPERKIPIITGQDADKKNMAAMLRGELTMTIFKDTRILAEQTVNMVNAIIAGKEPETNDIGNYNNGMKIVSTFLVRPQFVDISNYKEFLIDSGYYNESDIKD